MLQLLRRYGNTAISFQALEPGLEYWFESDDLCVPYADTGTAWVVAAEPLTEPTEIEGAMIRFCARARAHGRRPRFFGLEIPPATAELDALPIGEQPVWDPVHWPAALARKRRLREQIRRATHKGVTIRAIAPDEFAPGHATRAAVADLGRQWLESRAMAPLAFVTRVAPFAHAGERRALLAERDGAAVAALIAVPVHARNGWLVEDALRAPHAPNGTIELLFDTMLRQLGAEGSRWVTFGLAPLSGTSTPWLRGVRNLTHALYRFDSLRAFKAKLQPDSWQPVFLAYPRGERGLSAILDSLTAFADGSLLRFGWRTLIHRARAVVRILALALAPWTVLLALAPHDWFPSATVHWAWVSYDTLMFIGLMSLARRWSRSWATVLAFAAATDCTLGVWQLVVHDAALIRHIGHVAVIVMALAAPLLAAIFLWCSRDRNSLYDSAGDDCH